MVEATLDLVGLQRPNVAPPRAALRRTAASRHRATLADPLLIRGQQADPGDIQRAKSAVEILDLLEELRRAAAWRRRSSW